ncbi:group 1 glycosyl transferase [Cnuella takakiae]|nr:group 1 glycosyl transferase [Cnuella takakiae]
MIRICTSLADAGYEVMLVGRRYRNTPALVAQPFRQHRIHCWFIKGKLFYAEYNLRLFTWLLFQKANLLCAIDLDTILPVLFASKLKGTKRVYDAHELFCEMKEVVSRPRIYQFWKGVERYAVPQFRLGYTVNEPIRDILAREYGVHYEVIRNMPWLKPVKHTPEPEPFILYQGAVNEGRSFETLIPAFQWIDLPLHIYGDGNFLEQARALVQELGLSQKVLFKGKLVPTALQAQTPKATLGITIFENKGLSNYYSLANRFFDYMHAGVPQLCADYPVYRSINQEYEVAHLVADLSARNLASAINQLLASPAKLQTLRSNCLEAREVFSWQAEEKRLIHFYRSILG